MIHPAILHKDTQELLLLRIFDDLLRVHLLLRLLGFCVLLLPLQLLAHLSRPRAPRGLRIEAVRQRILGVRTPGEAKKLGRQVRGFDPAQWDEVKFNLVVAGNFYKFSQHPALRDYLLMTGDRVLVEASPVDSIWGIGLAADHLDAARPENWPGENLLGFALMAVRDQLRAA